MGWWVCEMTWVMYVLTSSIPSFITQSALMAECFRKALYMGPESRQRYPTGTLINLMSVDACRVADVNVVPMVHCKWLAD